MEPLLLLPKKLRFNTQAGTVEAAAAAAVPICRCPRLPLSPHPSQPFKPNCLWFEPTPMLWQLHSRGQ